MALGSHLTVMHVDFVIQQLEFMADLHEGDRVWISRGQILERDTNKGLLASVQRTLCGQSRDKTLAGIERVYENAFWWLDYFRGTGQPLEATDTPRLIAALEASFEGLITLQNTYVADAVFALRLQLLQKTTLQKTSKTRTRPPGPPPAKNPPGGRPALRGSGDTVTL